MPMTRRGILFGTLLLCAAVGGGLIWDEVKSYLCKDYLWINNDFACGGRHVVSKAGYRELENDLYDYINVKVAAGDVTEVSVYFRDLRSGPTFGINENENFAPASLLKLPLILTYFALAEEDPDLLNRKLQYTVGGIDTLPRVEQIMTSSTGLIPGEFYEIERLMQTAIVHSDNFSYYVLVAYLNATPDGSQKILRTFQELGIIDPRDEMEEVVTVRGYASLFRILYNVSYLTPEASEKILSWLVDSNFPKGLSGGVPEGMPVANKFGERQLLDGTKQLHDCGIVYYPGNPYAVCIMTKGHDWDVLADIIRDISRKIYEEVDSRRL